jgi:hypothetical protein
MRLKTVSTSRFVRIAGDVAEDGGTTTTLERSV